MCVIKIIQRASEASGADSLMSSRYIYIWRASVASETLTGVKMKKSGMFVYLFIYMDVRMSFCTLTLRIFCVRSALDPVPNFTKQNPPV